ncbi:MAG: dipicolinate synthase subunit DpsA [bacterium]|nr:dipicolinate synthase subunit DpsA [bacterium]
MRFLVVGGDLRQYYIAQSLKTSGHLTDVFGLDKTDLEQTTIDKIKNTKYDAVILPMPLSLDQIHLNCPLNSYKLVITELLNSLNNTKIFGGIINEKFLKPINHNTLIDFTKDEELLLENAQLTTEGALLTAIQNTNRAIYKSNCLCVGYGRIGKSLSQALNTLGANVTVSARKATDLKAICKNGMTQILTSEIDIYINKFDIIFNTVPARVINDEALKHCKNDVTIIELASAPFGFDRETANSLKLNTIYAPSLPGKYSPKSAGEIILKTIFKNI